MRLRRVVPVVLSLCLVVLAGCRIFPDWEGEFQAGPVDPVLYPPAYLGTGGDRLRPGQGTLNEVAAFAEGGAANYFAFPFPSGMFPLPSRNPPDPLAVWLGAGPNPALPVVDAFVFNPNPPTSAFPSFQRCVYPSDYEPDERLYDISYAEQGNLFTGLPTATYTEGRTPSWTYTPIVAQRPLGIGERECQSVKSKDGLSKDEQDAPYDGFYLAWPIIDVGASVFRVGKSAADSTGLGVQRFGWYEHYLLAYLDGGYIPTQTDGSGVVRMVPQRLYYPRSQVSRTSSSGMTTTGAGAIGQGYDVLEAARGDSGYSPVCQVFTYSTGSEPVAREDLPRSAQDIVDLYGDTLQPANPPLIFCVQVPEGARNDARNY